MEAKSTPADDGIKPKARDCIHTTILDWISSQPRGKVLDAPAGFGHLSMRLREMGFEVTCGEIEPEIFKVEGLRCVYTDLNRKIDAPDASFDYVCCVDGLEHMTDPYTAVREFAHAADVVERGVRRVNLPVQVRIDAAQPLDLEDFGLDLAAGHLKPHLPQAHAQVPEARGGIQHFPARLAGNPVEDGRVDAVPGLGLDPVIGGRALRFHMRLLLCWLSVSQDWPP
jgi:hypothetical protein